MEALRREGNGHADDVAEDPMFAEHVPEGYAFAKQTRIGLAQRNVIRADLPDLPG